MLTIPKTRETIARVWFCPSVPDGLGGDRADPPFEAKPPCWTGGGDHCGVEVDGGDGGSKGLNDDPIFGSGSRNDGGSGGGASGLEGLLSPNGDGIGGVVIFPM